MANKTQNQDKKNKQTKTVLPFHQRFNIKVQDEEAKQRFLNRVSNRVVDSFFSEIEEEGEEKEDLIYDDIMWEVANSLGETFSYSKNLNNYINGDFYACLHALEVVYKELPKDAQKKELGEIIQTITSESEIDLGVRWREGIFLPSGAKLLDEALVNVSLQWLSDPKYCDVLAPFQKGLSHFLESNKHPERLIDTIRDMYETLEKMARTICGNNKNLKANTEQFVSKLTLSTYYTKMLKDYTEFAHEFRHAVEEGKERKLPAPQEVEAFVYTTGLFIRLAVESHP